MFGLVSFFPLFFYFFFFSLVVYGRAVLFAHHGINRGLTKSFRSWLFDFLIVLLFFIFPVDGFCLFCSFFIVLRAAWSIGCWSDAVA